MQTKAVATFLDYDVTQSKWRVQITVRVVATGQSHGKTPALATASVTGGASGVATASLANNTSYGGSIIESSLIVFVSANSGFDLKSTSYASGTQFNATVSIAGRPAPPQKKRATFILENPTQVPITYQVIDQDPSGNYLADVVLRTVTLQPGESQSVTVEVSDGHAVAVIGMATDIDGAGTGNTVWNAGKIESAGMTPVVGNGSDSTPVSINTSSSTTAPAAIKTTGGATSTVTHNVFNSTEAAKTDALSNGVFAQGVNGMTSKLVGSLDAINKSLAANTGGAGGATDMTATNGKLDTVAGKVDLLASKVDASNALLTTIKTDIKGDAIADAPVTYTPPTISNETVNATTAGIIAKLPTAPTVTGVAAQSSFSVTFTPPGLTTSQTFTVDLATYPAVAVFRGLCLAGLTIMFFLVTVKTIRSAFA